MLGWDMVATGEECLRQQQQYMQSACPHWWRNRKVGPGRSRVGRKEDGRDGDGGKQWSGQIT